VGFLALRLLFEALLGSFVVAAARRARVGAENEDRLRLEQQERVAVEGVPRFAGELEGLQLGGDPEGDEADQDPGERRDPDPFEDAADVEGRSRRSRPARLTILARLALRQPCMVAQGRQIRAFQAGKQPLAGAVDLVLRLVFGRLGGPLLAVGGHERLEIMAMYSVIRLPASCRP